MGADLVLVSRTEPGAWRRWPRSCAPRRPASLSRSRPTSPTRTRGCTCVDKALEAFGRVDCVHQQRLRASRRWTRSPRSTRVEACATANETNVFAPLRLSALFADALADVQGLDHHAQLLRARSARQPEYAGYKLSKGALEHLASSLATEVCPRGIRVNSAGRPTSTRTSTSPLLRLARLGGRHHPRTTSTPRRPTLAHLKRLASPEEVARATLFLATDLAPAVTGQTLTVDCGEFHSDSLPRWPSLSRSESGAPMSDNVMTRERPDVGSYDDIVAAAAAHHRP